MDTLNDIIKRYMNQGLTALEIKKRLDQDGYNVSWYEIKFTFNKLKSQAYMEAKNG